MMNSLMAHLYFVNVYLDDVVMFSESLFSHIAHLRVVIKLIARSSLKVKLSKCQLAYLCITLLGHNVDKNCIRVDTAKVKVIGETSSPTSRTALQSSLGI